MSHRPPARPIIAGLAIAVALVAPLAHGRAPAAPRLDDEIFLAEVVRHLYRWYLDRGVVTMGRYGTWDYLAMEDSLVHGRQVAAWIDERS